MQFSCVFEQVPTADLRLVFYHVMDIHTKANYTNHVSKPHRFQHEEINAMVAAVEIAHRMFERVLVHFLQNVGAEVPPSRTHVTMAGQRRFDRAFVAT